ncbi:MAG: hypothetical protein H0T89_27825 [Deltaproteobacteria bacterium]|nr:hypothetical protein [Deltaproteobacteria bacterium]MDQ3298602.1 hypothetical protein [Myxococcota bacterium]
MTRSHLRTLGLAVLLLVALGSPQHYRDGLYTANESARVFAAEAIVRHGTLDLRMPRHAGAPWSTCDH